MDKYLLKKGFRLVSVSILSCFIGPVIVYQSFKNKDHPLIDLSVVLEFGVNIPSVCVKLQSAVKKAVEDMTGQKIFAVNIVVQGIRNKNEVSSEESL